MKQKFFILNDIQSIYWTCQIGYMMSMEARAASFVHFSWFQLKYIKCPWDLERSRHHQLPSGINPEVKRNPQTPIMQGFKLKKAKCPCDLQGPLEGPRGAGHRQGPSGVDPKVKRNHLNQKKICGLCSLGDLLEAKMKAAIWWKLKVCTKTLN